MTERPISSDDWREQCPILCECVEEEPTSLDVKNRLMQIPKMLSMLGILAQIWHSFWTVEVCFQDGSVAHFFFYWGSDRPKDFHGPTVESALMKAISSKVSTTAPSTAMQRHTGWTWIKPNSAVWLLMMSSKLECWSSCTSNILTEPLTFLYMYIYIYFFDVCFFLFVSTCFVFFSHCHYIRGICCWLVVPRMSNFFQNRQNTPSKSLWPEAIHGACWSSSPSVVMRLLAGQWLLSNCLRLTWSWRMSKLREFLSAFALL